MKLVLVCFLIISSSFANDSVLSKEGEVLEFNEIKKILQNDGLSENAKNKQKKIVKAKSNISKKMTAMFDVPKEGELLGFATELWLVKNAPILKWDFQKPDYGLDKSFESFLEQMGNYEQKFKILLVNSPNVSHFALPGYDGEIIFLLSQPFIRSLDLSKLEISILLYEDYLRYKMNFFNAFVLKDKGIVEMIGKNFKGGKFDMSAFDKLLDGYDKKVLDTGFTFKEQYRVTTKLGNMFKGNMKLWNYYVGLITKIDELVKNNLLYEKYNSIYPSPELQLGWLKPKAKLL